LDCAAAQASSWPARDNQFHDRGSPMADGCGHETGDVNNIEDPQIAINARGDAVAVWVARRQPDQTHLVEPLHRRQRLGNSAGHHP